MISFTGRLGGLLRGGAIGLALLGPTIAAVFAADTVMQVSQKYRAFHPGAIEIFVGQTVHIVNDDEFSHQIYVDNPAFKFESDEKDPGESINLKFPVAGTFEVHCHIHPRMRLLVTVKPG